MMLDGDRCGSILARQDASAMAAECEALRVRLERAESERDDARQALVCETEPSRRLDVRAAIARALALDADYCAPDESCASGYRPCDEDLADVAGLCVSDPRAVIACDDWIGLVALARRDNAPEESEK